MAEFVKVAVDAMGGDNAPVEIVKGAIEAVNEDHRVKVFLVGQEEVVKAELTKYTYPEEQVEVVNATEIIETAEPPVMAIRKKKDSSTGRRSGDRRQDQGCRETSAGTAYPDSKGMLPSD